MSKKFDDFKFKWYGMLFRFYGKILDRVHAKLHASIGNKNFRKWLNISKHFMKKRDVLLGKRQELLRKRLQRVRGL